MKINIYIICFVVGLIFPEPALDRLPILEISLGKNYPTGVYDKYADSGFSARLAYSRQFKNTEYFRGQFGFQYIHFNTDRSTEYFELSNGVMGPNIDLERRERALLFNAGVRYSMNKGLVKNGYFRPYIGGYLGLANFRDATFYDWSDNNCDDPNLIGLIIDVFFDTEFSCIGDNNNGNQSTTVHDKMTKPFYSVEIGSNVHFPKTERSGVGLDFGIRYNMISGLDRSDTSFDESNNEISTLSRNLKANYYTLYVGVFVVFGKVKNNNSQPTIKPGHTI